MSMINLKNNIENIIFDLDGTLVNSSPGILLCLNNVIKNKDIKPKVELNNKLIGPPLLDMMKIVSGIENIYKLEDLANDFKSCYDSKGYKKTILFDGITKMLAELISKNVKLFIATNKRDKPTKKIIKHLSLDEFFTSLYTVDMDKELFQSKSIMIATIIKNHKLDISKTMYVGDTNADALAAFENKIRYIMTDWGYSDLSNFNGEVAISSQNLLQKILRA
jgi:phosphoglycolate phosphatase